MSDTAFMQLARDNADAFSEDRTRQVGCVIVGPDDKVRSAGANRFPRGVDASVNARHQRPEKYFWIEHAERNAIYAAARNGVSLLDCLIYLPWFPCMDCARAIIQSGIKELISGQVPDMKDPKWGEDFARVEVLLAEGGVTVRFLAVTV